MQLTIKSFNTHKTALTVAAVFAVSSLLFLLPFMLMSMFMPSTTPDGKPMNMATPMFVMTLIMPIFYFIFGYAGIRFSSWAYNKISSKTGGIVVTVEQQEI